ncbi:DUF362 domain-containing protein [Caldanaerobius polysaccharolyticus]|uniref:DUF362 domain-containing protein n=1 Tax=Caldanaerobius polysaccharolyticus TaxID=44256 RepID=UPI0004791F65|nr:DUF362 domain-containing protein [Caldanaerobius polysaccharolyticus]
MGSKVLFASVKYNKYDADVTLPAKFGRLIDRMSQEMALEEVVKDKWTAVKMHLGRGIGYSTIHPLFVKLLVDKLKGYGAKVFITDQVVEGARNRGYTEELLGVPIVPVCGLMNRYYYEKEVDFKTFKNVDVGGYIHDAEVMINLSHVKGHGACGYGGACKNIAMGCVTDRTRQQIHGLEGGLEWDEELCIHCEMCVKSCNHNANSFDENGKYRVFYHHCTLCQHCVKVCPTGAIKMNAHQYEDFQKGMAICTEEVLKTFKPGHVFYINFLTNITALCDCWGLTTPSLVPDIGVMASQDIVAIERACLDAIKVEDLIPSGIPQGLELGQKGHLFERLHGKDPFVQLRELENRNLGTQEYTVEEVF